MNPLWYFVLVPAGVVALGLLLWVLLCLFIFALRIFDLCWQGKDVDLCPYSPERKYKK